jgi:cyclophilin family peptidyl-prolyl cis-trans isomerase
MAAITDLSTASSVAVGDYLVVSQSGTDKKVTANKFAVVSLANTFTGEPGREEAGGDSAFGGEFVDELNASTLSYKTGYKKGVLAMANRGPNTNTSQFFIMLDDVELPKNYTIFGKVVVGLDVVDKIGAVEIIPQMGATDGKPVEPIVIQTAVISDK